MPFQNPILLGILLFGLVGSLTVLLAGWVRKYALQHLLDLPNTRSSHVQPTPRGGGLAIVAAFFLSLLVLLQPTEMPLPLFWALSALIPLAIIGFVDDHGHVPARWRLLLQVLAAAWLLVWIKPSGLGWPGYLGTAFCIVWVINLFNFMDGIDGIAGVEAMTTTLSAAWLLSLHPTGSFPPEGFICLALAAASLGFLVWNWPPARLFMGDVGSGVLGFLLAALALWTSQQGLLGLPAWLILGGVFLVDATLTLLIRLLKGNRWYEAHRSHAYQHASRHWGSHRPVTIGVLLVNIFWLLPWAWVATQHPERQYQAVMVALLPLIVLAGWLGAGQERRQGS